MPPPAEWAGRDLTPVLAGTHPARPDEFYDLRQDPHEATNLAGHPRAKPTETRLRRTLDDWMKKTEDPFRTKR